MDKTEAEVNVEQREQVRELLKEHQKVLALPRQPLGWTELAKHEIETRFQAPINLAVRRPPFLKFTAKEEVKKMLENDIITQ